MGPDIRSVWIPLAYISNTLQLGPFYKSGVGLGHTTNIIYEKSKKMKIVHNNSNMLSQQITYKMLDIYLHKNDYFSLTKFYPKFL